MINEESSLIDYLKSFELIDQIAELKKDQTLFDAVIDINYKKQIIQYVESISINFEQSAIRYFIGENFNILFVIMIYYKVTSFKSFIQYVKELNSKQLLKILELHFHIDTEFNLVAISSLSLSFKDKWNLAFITKEFDDIKQQLIDELNKNYEIYTSHIKTLLLQYKEKINQVLSILSNDDYLYTQILNKSINKEIFKKIDKRMILLTSVNEMIVYHKEESLQFIAIGLYVFDYYLEVERQKQLDELNLIQVLKSLSDTTRYGIVKNVNRGITSNSVLASMFEISRAAISMQFKYLQEHNIIVADKTTKQYTVNKEIIHQALKIVCLELDLEDK